MVTAAVIGAGVAGSMISADAASSAADQQAGAARNAQAISQQQYQDTVNRNAPYTQVGYGALNQLDYLLGIGPSGGGTSGYGAPQGYGSPQGYDPSSGYRIGAGGGVSQLIPGGSAPLGGASRGQMGGSARMLATGDNGFSIAAPTMTGTQGMPPSGNYVQSGAPATGSTAGGYGSLLKPFDVSDWQNLSPAYNFQLRQGQQGVLNASASGQGALSGAAYKDLIDYNQNAANTSFNNAFNQYQTQQGNIYSRLSGIAQLGQASANNTGQQGTALAGQAAQSATNVGTALAGGTVGAANAWSGGLQSAAPWLAYGGGGGNPNNNAANWDTENPSNFQDFAVG